MLSRGEVLDGKYQIPARAAAKPALAAPEETPKPTPAAVPAPPAASTGWIIRATL